MKERDIANNSVKRKSWPQPTEESGHYCKQCDASIKLKHIYRAMDNKHQPPDHCYSCLSKKKGKKTSRERKVELAKQRAREREARLGPSA